ncbi:PREDICTED: rho guanine nucleotide exchange factor 39-like isoform X1 [Cyprinodon variegatus]|uniref:rho guanine nucleotide exchange factor 39-like isoform X1 n=1 Tax=Cyprinodon variegatus TaxID=28743 RepID=UPI0007426DB9|nr:PREDICTED: rho guanine nucleotide exchange factor 39-like isoform X1 [Cyprinodon variegatus]
MSFSPHPPSLSGSNSVEEQRSRWERKRSRAAKELVQTEQHYCQQLELVTTFFVEILKAKGTLKEDIREAIFSSIKSILSINRLGGKFLVFQLKLLSRCIQTKFIKP